VGLYRIEYAHYRKVLIAIFPRTRDNQRISFEEITLPAVGGSAFIKALLSAVDKQALLLFIGSSVRFPRLCATWCVCVALEIMTSQSSAVSGWDPRSNESAVSSSSSSSSSSLEGLPFLVTHWLAHYDDDGGAVDHDDQRRVAVERIRQASAELASAFSTLGAFGTAIRVSDIY